MVVYFGSNSDLGFENGIQVTVGGLVKSPLSPRVDQISVYILKRSESKPPRELLNNVVIQVNGIIQKQLSQQVPQGQVNEPPFTEVCPGLENRNEICMKKVRTIGNELCFRDIDDLVKRFSEIEDFGLNKVEIARFLFDFGAKLKNYNSKLALLLRVLDTLQPEFVSLMESFFIDVFSGRLDKKFVLGAINFIGSLSLEGFFDTRREVLVDFSSRFIANSLESFKSRNCSIMIECFLGAVESLLQFIFNVDHRHTVIDDTLDELREMSTNGFVAFRPRCLILFNRFAHFRNFPKLSRWSEKVQFFSDNPLPNPISRRLDYVNEDDHLDSMLMKLEKEDKEENSQRMTVSNQCFGGLYGPDVSKQYRQYRYELKMAKGNQSRPYCNDENVSVEPSASRLDCYSSLDSEDRVAAQEYCERPESSSSSTVSIHYKRFSQATPINDLENKENRQTLMPTMETPLYEKATVIRSPSKIRNQSNSSSPRSDSPLINSKCPNDQFLSPCLSSGRSDDVTVSQHPHSRPVTSRPTLHSQYCLGIQIVGWQGSSCILNRSIVDILWELFGETPKRLAKIVQGKSRSMLMICLRLPKNPYEWPSEWTCYYEELKELDPRIHFPLIDWVMNGVVLGDGVTLPAAQSLIFEHMFGLGGFVVQRPSGMAYLDLGYHFNDRPELFSYLFYTWHISKCSVIPLRHVKAEHQYAVDFIKLLQRRTVLSSENGEPNEITTGFIDSFGLLHGDHLVVSKINLQPISEYRKAFISEFQERNAFMGGLYPFSMFSSIETKGLRGVVPTGLEVDLSCCDPNAATLSEIGVIMVKVLSVEGNAKRQRENGSAEITILINGVCEQKLHKRQYISAFPCPLEQLKPGLLVPAIVNYPHIDVLHRYEHDHCHSVVNRGQVMIPCTEHEGWVDNLRVHPVNPNFYMVVCLLGWQTDYPATSDAIRNSVSKFQYDERFVRDQISKRAGYNVEFVDKIALSLGMTYMYKK